MKRLIFLILFSGAASAAEDPFKIQQQAYIGALGGLSIPDAPDTSERGILGIGAGAKLSDEFSIGGFYLTSSKGERSSTEAFDFRYAVYGVEANYHFEGSGIGAHFGARVGLGRINKDPVGRTYSATPLVLGLQAGYDLMLSPRVSLGAEVNTLFFNGGKRDPETGLEVSSFGALNFLAALKFWI